MEWYWQIIWQSVPYVVLIPFATLTFIIARRLYVRYRWQRQMENEIVITGPSAILAAFPTPKPFFAKSVALTFPGWGGFSGDVELFSGNEPIAKFQVPKHRKKLVDYFIPEALKAWRGALEWEVGKEVRGNELIARVDGDSQWLKRGDHGIKAKRNIILRITFFGEARA